MNKLFLAAFAIVVLSVPTSAQDLLGKLKQIEDANAAIAANNAAIQARIGQIESKVDAMAAKLDEHMSKNARPATGSGDISVTMPTIPAGKYEIYGPANIIPLASFTVPVNVPAGNYWLRPAASSSASATGQWTCGGDGICRWVSAPGTASTAQAGYEWQWINGAAYQVPLGYSYGYMSCGPTGCGPAAMYGYNGAYMGSGSGDGSGASGGGCLSKVFSRFKARRAARRGGGGC